ncbi:hypothetical protein PAMA_000159 [Pampus argenteus]
MHIQYAADNQRFLADNLLRHIENWTGLQTLRDVDMELYTGLQRLDQSSNSSRNTSGCGCSIASKASGFSVRYFSESDTIPANSLKEMTRCHSQVPLDVPEPPSLQRRSDS